MWYMATGTTRRPMSSCAGPRGSRTCASTPSDDASRVMRDEAGIGVGAQAALEAHPVRFEEAPPGQAQGMERRALYVTTTGGIVTPPGGVLQAAKLVRLEVGTDGYPLSGLA